SAAARIVSLGKTCFSSHSAAKGVMLSAVNRRAMSWIASWSSVRANWSVTLASFGKLRTSGVGFREMTPAHPELAESSLPRADHRVRLDLDLPPRVVEPGDRHQRARGPRRLERAAERGADRVGVLDVGDEHADPD